jgi:2-polyprenyl-3-methyl-5-hydroxy-6-metoxy-1,4-benzoquinol methylase
MAVYLAGRLIRSQSELVELYRERLDSGGFTSESLFYKTRQQHELKLRSYAQLISGLPAGESLLDVGCGYGELLRFARPRGQYVGIDMVEQFVQEARHRYPYQSFMAGNILDYCGLQSDWVLLVGVLSSVPEPEALLSRCALLARKGIMLDVTIGERLSEDYTDLTRWSEREIRRTLENLGLVVTASYDVGATWIILIGEHRPSIERARTGSRQGDE